MARPTTRKPNLRHGYPIVMVGKAAQLDVMFFLNTDRIADKLQKFDLEGRDVLRSSEDIPDITPEHVTMAISVIPMDYWQLSCWSCRD